MKAKWSMLLIVVLLMIIGISKYSKSSNNDINDSKVAYEYKQMISEPNGRTVELVNGLVSREYPFVVKHGDSTIESLESNSTLGQDFLTTRPFSSISIETPSLKSANASYTMTLYKDGPSGTKLYTVRVNNSADGITHMKVPAQENGRYYVEISDPQGEVGWVTQKVSYMLGSAYKNGQILPDQERVISMSEDSQATIGNTFTADRSFNTLLLSSPNSKQAGRIDVSLYYGGPDGVVASRSTVQFSDAQHAGTVTVGTMPPGKYYVELVNKGTLPVQFSLGATVYDHSVTGSNDSLAQNVDLALGYADSTNQAVQWDTHSDTWVATDELGRAVSTNEQVGPPRKDKFVGIFYFLWLGAHDSSGPYDNSKILAQDPNAMQKPDSPLWAPLGHPQYWGESLFGYYRSNDEFVLRKHAQMLADAGVDTVIFDNTNQFTYKENYMALLRVFTEVRNAGGKTPQIAFLTPFSDPSKVVQQLYDDLYSKGLYSDLWFKWNGKPLILADPAEVDSKYLSFFTFRKPIASYFTGPSGPDQWAWLESYPQHVFYDLDNKKEQMAVGVAQNAVNGRLGSMTEPGAQGRSFHDGQQPAKPYPTEIGYNVMEQWARALREDPKFIFVTGWNEWIAGRFDNFVGITQPVMFVDEFNQEFSRDIEPMKGGHGDDYYYQLADYIRKFKGTNPIPHAGKPHKINVDGNFQDWKNVQPEFRDDIGDTMHRDFKGVANASTYINNTGRNDIVLSKVERDNDYIYFYVQTRDPMTPYTDPNWMQLYIDTDGNAATGWHGYDILVNQTVTDAHTTVVKSSAGGWNWKIVGSANYNMNGKEMEITIPRKWLGLEGKSKFQFDFKWADNMQKADDIMEFTVNGDSAPNDRFNYRYIAQ